MRKILISVLIVLLIVMAFVIMFKGLSIGNFHILSISQIKEENDKLTNEIAQTELLMYNTYRTTTDDLSKASEDLSTAKNAYLDLASVSTKNELTKANTEETYTVEFLWTRLGRHATAEGVNIAYTISSGAADNLNSITFTVTGDYIPIINFVSSVEDDSELGFRIENFKLVPNGEVLQGTFTVKNVRVKLENATSKIQDNAINSKENRKNNDNSENAGNNTNTDTNTVNEEGNANTANANN